METRCAGLPGYPDNHAGTGPEGNGSEGVDELGHLITHNPERQKPYTTGTKGLPVLVLRLFIAATGSSRNRRSSSPGVSSGAHGGVPMTLDLSSCYKGGTVKLGGSRSFPNIHVKNSCCLTLGQLIFGAGCVFWGRTILALALTH
jgi:hypothetical protein